MSRRKFTVPALDLSRWPTVAVTALPRDVRTVYRAREEAVRLYAGGTTLAEIHEQTGVRRNVLYHLVQRALADHEDGRVQGFRGLLPYRHLVPYTRKQPPAHPKDPEVGEAGWEAGHAGVFGYLLRTYPALARWFDHKVSERHVLIDVLPTQDEPRIRLRRLEALHDEFMRECRKIGLTHTDYPFSTDALGIRALSRAVKRALLRRFHHAAHASGAQHLRGLPGLGHAMQAPMARRPYEVVEFDGHKLDLRLTVHEEDPLGIARQYEIERVYVLVVIDVFTRCVLGYYLTLASEYSAADVIGAIERSLIPHRPRALTSAGLRYDARGGFPSSKFPELAYACWDWLRLDNAKANLAEDTRQVLCEFLGCLMDAGPAYSPDERPYIERFFGTLARSFSHRLPHTTASHPKELRRLLGDPRGKTRLMLSTDELADALDVAIGQYNGESNDGLGALAPLEAMEYFVRKKGELPRWIAEPYRRSLCLLQKARCCTVRGSIQSGARPHINFFGVRHTNRLLAQSAWLIGKELLVYYNPEDLRSVRAYLDDGQEFGILEAEGGWKDSAHSLKLRQEILRLRRARRFSYAANEDPVATYVQTLQGRAATSRKAATALAKLKRKKAESPVRAQPPKSFQVTVTPAPPAPTQEPVAEDVPRRTPRPTRLRIGTGHSF